MLSSSSHCMRSGSESLYLSSAFLVAYTALYSASAKVSAPADTGARLEPGTSAAASAVRRVVGWMTTADHVALDGASTLEPYQLHLDLQLRKLGSPNCYARTHAQDARTHECTRARTHAHTRTHTHIHMFSW